MLGSLHVTDTVMSVAGRPVKSRCGEVVLQPMRMVAAITASNDAMVFIMVWSCCLTKKAEPPPTRDVNRDSGTASANGGSGDWLGIRFIFKVTNRIQYLADLISVVTPLCQVKSFVKKSALLCKVIKVICASR